MDFSCSKCGSINITIEDRVNQKALICKDCNSWLKWISKKDLPLAIKFIREHNDDEDKMVKKLTDMTLKEILDLKEEIKLKVINILIKQISEDNLYNAIAHFETDEEFNKYKKYLDV